jgi:TrmH family RNA methyltransferase
VREERDKMAFYGEIITSSQNKFVSLARSLGDKKHREKNGLFRFDGVKLMCEAIKRGVELYFLLIAESAYDTVFQKASSLYGIDGNSLNFKAVVVSDRLFEQISDENAPEGVICVAKYDLDRHRLLGENDTISEEAEEKILLLESVRDPLNVGAIMRVAVAFGVDRVIMSRDCADIYNSKTVRASMGAVFALKTDRIESISAAVEQIKSSGRRVFAAALDENAQRLGELEIRKGDCVLVGNEGHGISKEAIDACDASVYIPMSDGVESLNAATAAAVLAWEFFGTCR